MSKVKIQLLTEMHIGSGNTLMYGNDFVIGKDSEGYDVISIIDPEKVAKLIGYQRIGSWTAEIDLGKSTDEIVKRYCPSAKIEDYSKRIIDCENENVSKTDTIKEFIHDGFGKPFIPGSSIKGAIRTAILETIAAQKTDLENTVKQTKSKKNLETDAEKRLFGDNPNSDCFRFIQVGDAIFGNNYETIVKMVNINERPHKGYWDTSKPQYVEVLPNGDESHFELKLKTDICNWSRKRAAKTDMHALPECASTLNQLFQTINHHTVKLLKEELEYWSPKKEFDDSGKIDKYLNSVKNILSTAESSEGTNGKSCVIRIGHGSGWRFITGAWTETFSNFKTVIVPASRPNSDKYKQYDFPKSRRVSKDCGLLGFAKLTLED